MFNKYGIESASDESFWFKHKTLSYLLTKIEKPMYVKNVNGSGRDSAPSGYSSWLDYWKKQTKENPTYCSASKCYNTDLVGAHVQKAYTSDNSWYIVPLCSSCNGKSSNDIFEVNATLVPVPSRL
jgi:hypothetical protein